MKRMKRVAALVLAASMVLGSAFTSIAASWQQNATGWWWQNDDGTWPANEWRWLDGNNDGVAECYYFDSNGYMAANTTTPDGYQVNTDGAWVVNGAIQTQVANTNTSTTGTANHNAGYDPAHPLAGKIDEWNLRLPSNTLTGFSICSDSLQALLTGQMDYYNYLDIANYGTLIDGVYVGERNGSTFYVTEEDYIKGKQEDQQLYNWFCNWLNGMDFENMSEMDKAKEIQKVLASAEYEYGAESRNPYCSVLINKKGYCGEFAMTAMGLAKALGLKSAVNGTGDHAVYYIQVDGVAYFGQNDELNLAVPTPDNVYFN